MAYAQTLRDLDILAGKFPTRLEVCQLCYTFENNIIFRKYACYKSTRFLHVSF